MNNFTYSIPTTVYFGKGQIRHLGEAILAHGSRALLVYGGGSIKKNGVYDAAVQIMKENQISFSELSGVEPNPRIETVRRGVDICRQENIDIVVALGGGSTIDCAKVVAAAAAYEGDAWDIVLDASKSPSVLPVVAVLTIAATGSEMDPVAVISDMNSNEKLATARAEMRPVAAIMDPQYTFSVSRYQTASGTADILSHTLESYFSPVYSAYFQSQMALAVLKTCIKYGPVALDKPDDYEARANLMWAGSYAINDTLSLGNETGWSVHPMEHELSAFYDITHGVGLAILTPHWMREVLSEETLPRFTQLGVELFQLSPQTPPMELANQTIDAVADFLFQQLGLPSTLSEVGIGEENIQRMASKCAPRLAGGFVPLSQERIEAIYRAAL